VRDIHVTGTIERGMRESGTMEPETLEMMKGGKENRKKENSGPKFLQRMTPSPANRVHGGEHLQERSPANPVRLQQLF
jgi:hypothetical protein